MSEKNQTSSSFINGKNVLSIGNIDIIYRGNNIECTFSVTFINRMNNQSMSIHKFEKAKYAVEFASPNGVDHVLAFKGVEVALELALLNTDITRISEDDAIKARQAFVRSVSYFEPRAKNIRFTEKAWKLNKFRNKKVIFDTDSGEKCTGILNVILPPAGKTCLITPDNKKDSRLTLSCDQIWIQ